MDEPELEQRVEEIELALVDVFESPKAPAISSYDEGSRLFVQVSWVVESHADTTLDARCVMTLVFARAQFERYAAMDTAQRKAFQKQLGEWAHRQFTERQNPPPTQGDCAMEAEVPNDLFDAAISQ